MGCIEWLFDSDSDDDAIPPRRAVLAVRATLKAPDTGCSAGPTTRHRAWRRWCGRLSCANIVSASIGRSRRAGGAHERSAAGSRAVRRTDRTTVGREAAIPDSSTGAGSPSWWPHRKNATSSWPKHPRPQRCDRLLSRRLLGIDEAFSEPVTALVDVFARALELAGVGCEVLGFTTASWNGGRVPRDWNRAGKTRNPGRLNEVPHLVIKSANTRYRPLVPRWPVSLGSTSTGKVSTVKRSSGPQSAGSA